MDLRPLTQALRALPPGSLVALPREALLEALGVGAGEVARPTEAVVDLTVPQVAKLFGRAPSTVRQWLKARLLDGYKLRGREWRIPQTAIAAFQERQRTVPRDHDAPAPRPARGTSLGDWQRITADRRPDQRRDEQHDERHD